MDNLSAESKSLYEILKAESREEYEARFLAHKKEILDAMRDYVTDTTKQIQEINTAVDSVRIGMGKELTEAREALGTELEAVKARSESLKNFDGRVKKATGEFESVQAEAESLRKLLASRSAATVAMNAVRSSLLPGMWIEKWADGKVTIRGWKDRIRKSMESVKGKTAGELVAERLRGKAAVDPATVKISDMSSVGKDGLVEQFTVELKFK
jgi:hypothetical protein